MKRPAIGPEAIPYGTGIGGTGPASKFATELQAPPSAELQSPGSRAAPRAAPSLFGSGFQLARRYCRRQLLGERRHRSLARCALPHSPGSECGPRQRTLRIVRGLFRLLPEEVPTVD
jgi:hypothetical protein